MKPLAYRLRPTTLDEFVGQQHIINNDSLLRKMIDSDNLRSAIFYGPCGCGKTTLAEIIANMTKSNFVRLNATSSGINDIRNVIKNAIINRDLNNQKTILFIDEIHRYPRNIQDALLSPTEEEILTVIMATTQNPFFSIVSPLISRSNIFEFKPLTKKDLFTCLLRGIKYYKTRNIKVHIKPDAAKYWAIVSNGDARKILNALELAVESLNNNKQNIVININLAKRIMPNKFMIFDKSGDGHFDYASMLQGAIQASDPNTAVYAVAAALESGEDPLYIARRLFVAAAEDVGVGNPIAMPMALATVEACKMIGLPECALHLSALAIFLATCKRNKSAAMAIWEAQSDIRNGLTLEIPPEIRDCHYEGAKQLNRGSYHDGMNQEKYVGIDKKYFRPEDYA